MVLEYIPLLLSLMIGLMVHCYRGLPVPKETKLNKSSNNVIGFKDIFLRISL